MICNNSIRHSLIVFLPLLLLSGCTENTKQKKGIAREKPPASSAHTKESKKEQRIKELSKGINKNITDMNLVELGRAKEFALLVDNKDSAIKILDRMIILSTDQQEIAHLQLERADLYFDQGRFQKAGKLYEDYIKMYPGSEKIDEVKYKAILCRFYETLDIDRDQTKTKNTLALANEYLKRPEIFIKYQKDVKDIQKKCCKKLLENELYVFNFYLKKHNIKAAQLRLDFMRDHYMPIIPEIEPELICLECELATKIGDHTRVKEKIEELTKRFPQHQTPLLAQNKKPEYVKKF